jgi:RNA polymerase sigma-70 factor (ECF subfamily)
MWVEVRLVERARAGDHAAFRALIDVATHRCYAIAFRIVRDPEGARDAVQQAFLQAWRDLPGLREPDRFEPWLHRLLVRACYAETRRARGWAKATGKLDIYPATSGDDFTSQIANRDALDRAFRRLSPEHRAVMVLQHYLDMPIASIADVVGVPVGTVKSRIHHATRELRTALDADSRVPTPKERPA